MYISIHPVGALCYDVQSSSWQNVWRAFISLIFVYMNDCEIFRTIKLLWKLMWNPLVLVALHVQCQVVWTREAATAGDAFEGFRSGVFAVMPRQFIRAGETPVTSFPTASVWLLTCTKKKEKKTELNHIHWKKK